MPENLYVDGENIIEVLKGNQQDHKAIFTMRGETIKTVRKGEWKLFVEKPGFYRPVDLATWVDKRAPDGTTIIAPYEQATPAQYPGIKPMKMDGDIFLFNLGNDIGEMTNVAGENPGVIEALEEEYNKFMTSLKEK